MIFSGNLLKGMLTKIVINNIIFRKVSLTAGIIHKFTI